ncbi:MAG: sterol desaturase family protein [Thermodesulfobacteriota bacterium]
MEALYSLKPYIYWSGFLVFLLLETIFPYRPATVAKGRRWLTNVPLAIINGTIYHLLFTAALMALAAEVEASGTGLLNSWLAPGWLKILAAILILDFFIYLWHLLTHSVPLLWRFHQVHHSDLNMDVTTGNRFHLGEFLVTGFIRLAVIYTFGIPWAAYVLFEILVNLAVQFHHSGIKTNPAFERVWALLFVPPSLHRIHHSVRRQECDSNYGVIFSLWDRMAGTLLTKVDQEEIVIGLKTQRQLARLGFWQLQLMPLGRKKPQD